jgi:hypothetical protein
MMFPRVTAVIFVLLLIGSLATVGIGGVAEIGPALVHGNAVKHADGTIVAISPTQTFVLKTAGGQKIQFRCEERCSHDLPHLQRHVREKAHTDVYYIEQPGGLPEAIDVD